MMKMQNPPHPGEIIQFTLLHMAIERLNYETGLSIEKIENVINLNISVDEEIASAISRFTGTTKESWLAQQLNYDEWHKNNEIPNN